jgi:RNA polymerase sigma-70 factor (ECF subfamily)
MTEADQIDPERWVAEYGDYLFRYAVSRLRDQAAAEDVVQDTFLAAFKNRGSFSGRSAEKTWLVGILKHKIVDFIRKDSREQTYDDAERIDGKLDDFFDRKGHWKAGPSEWTVNPRKAFEQREFWGVLQACLDGLKGRHRTAFVLREMDGVSGEEICNALDVTPTNLWVMLYRAREKLQVCLQEKWFKANQ